MTGTSYGISSSQLTTSTGEMIPFPHWMIISMTKYCSLVSQLPKVINIYDASRFSIGVGEDLDVHLTSFCLQWPQNIAANIILYENSHGTIKKSDLESARFELLWSVMEGVQVSVTWIHAALFSDNSPTVCIGSNAFHPKQFFQLHSLFKPWHSIYTAKSPSWQH